MLDETKVKELLEVYDEVYTTEEEVRDIVSGAKTRVKEARTMMKDFAERSELNPKTIKRVYADYKEWRNGNLKWGDNQESDDYVTLQVAVMDEAVKESGS
jgi:hypothetical protein